MKKRICFLPKNGYVNLANYISKMKKRHDVIRFVSSMRPTRLQKFLKFLNNESLLNDGLMTLFLEVLSASPVLALTEFLRSIDRERLYEQILSENDEDRVLFADQVCFNFLKGLISLDRIHDAVYFLDNVLERYDDERFEDLMYSLINETSNDQVELDERHKLFAFMTTIPQQLLWYIRMDEQNPSHSVAVQFLNDEMSKISNTLAVEFRPFIMPDLQEVDAEFFVDKTFPLAPERSSSDEQQRQCLICQENESKCDSALRLLPCCSARCADPICVCHCCIVLLSKYHNAEKPENRFERGTHVLCPNCRNPFPFFPQNS